MRATADRLRTTTKPAREESPQEARRAGFVASFRQASLRALEIQAWSGHAGLRRFERLRVCRIPERCNSRLTEELFDATKRLTAKSDRAVGGIRSEMEDRPAMFEVGF